MKKFALILLLALAGVLALTSACLTCKSQSADSVASNELAGAITENEVLVSDSSPRSCWEAIRLTPSETSTFFAHVSGHRKVTMDSHEVRKALTWFVKNHFTKQNPSLECASRVILEIALAHPKELSAWINAFVRYRKAEGVDPEKLIRARINEQPLYKGIKVGGEK